MDQATHSKIVSFLRGIADDVLRGLFKRGKYQDVILPMCILRRLDAVLKEIRADILAVQATSGVGQVSDESSVPHPCRPRGRGNWCFIGPRMGGLAGAAHPGVCLVDAQSDCRSPPTR